MGPVPPRPGPAGAQGPTPPLQSAGRRGEGPAGDSTRTLSNSFVFERINALELGPILGHVSESRGQTLCFHALPTILLTPLKSKYV